MSQEERGHSLLSLTPSPESPGPQPVLGKTGLLAALPSLPHTGGPCPPLPGRPPADLSPGRPPTAHTPSSDTDPGVASPGILFYGHRDGSAGSRPARPGLAPAAELLSHAQLFHRLPARDGPDSPGTPLVCRAAAGPALAAQSGLDGLWSQPGSGRAWTCGLGFRLGPAEFPLWASVSQERRGRPGVTLVLGDTGLRGKDLRRLAGTRRTSLSQPARGAAQSRTQV